MMFDTELMPETAPFVYKCRNCHQKFERVIRVDAPQPLLQVLVVKRPELLYAEHRCASGHYALCDLIRRGPLSIPEAGAAGLEPATSGLTVRRSAS